MLIHTVILRDDPVLQARLRAANEERAATMRAAFKGLFRLVAAPVRLAAAALVRAHRRSRALQQLGGLDDRALADIGIHRNEIRSLAEASAVIDPAVSLSVRDLRSVVAGMAPLRETIPAAESTSENAGAIGLDVAAIATRCREVTGKVADRVVLGTPSGHPA